MKTYKITATNHDYGDSTIMVGCDEKTADSTIELLRQCGYRTIIKTENA